MTEYKAFSNTVVVFKEPTVSQIVPKSGPNAGKETSVLEFKAYKPHFVKQKDGSFQQDKDGTEFFSVRYYGKESSAKRMAAGIKEGTLIAAMEKIHTVVDNPEYKKYLKEGDGIGTPATRAAIISELKRKGYLETKGKKICASSDGIELLKLVPELVRNPILTAVFERKLRDVESGKSTLGSFIESQQKFILQEINKAKAINNGLQ